MDAWFFLRRPNTDFVSNRREAGRLKPEAKDNPLVPIKPDTDNLAKFLLDALTGLVFHDDAQVVEVHMFKMRDNRGLCEGETAVWVHNASNWRANTDSNTDTK